MQSYCHLVLIQGSGAGSLKPLIYEDAIELSTVTEAFGAELLKDLRGLGKPPSFDGNGAEHQDFRVSFRINMSFVSSLSIVDGQVRNRAESDLPGNSEIAGRCTLHVLHTDVLIVGLDNERQCPNSCPIR